MAGFDFGAVIRERRGSLGLNQVSLAEKIGVSRNTVAGWETGHSRPDLGTVPLLCEALGITPGPEMGEILKTLLGEVLGTPSLNTKEQLIRRAGQLMKH